MTIDNPEPRHRWTGGLAMRLETYDEEPQMTDLVTRARDEQQAAHVVVVTAHNPYLNQERSEVYVLHEGMLWSPCMHSHSSERSVATCVRKTARRWEKARTAPSIVLVNGDTTVEYQWLSPSGSGGMVCGRDRPKEPYGEMDDRGPVTDLK